MFKFEFLGTRGSISFCAQDKIKAGCNTTCIILHIHDKIIIVDAGTGIKNAAGVLPQKSAALFITHAHLDHIIGLPFFGALYDAKNDVSIYGCKTASGRTLESALRSFLDKDFWPIGFDDFAAKISAHDITEGNIDFAPDISVASLFLRHPAPTLGYKFQADGKSACFIFDHETQGQDAPLIEFIAGANCVVFDAMYTEKEYLAGKQGWGHSTYEAALKICEAANVETLIFSHHSPERTDAELFALEKKYAKNAGKGKIKNICAAREGAVFEV